MSYDSKKYRISKGRYNFLLKRNEKEGLTAKEILQVLEYQLEEPKRQNKAKKNKILQDRSLKSHRSKYGLE